MKRILEYCNDFINFINTSPVLSKGPIRLGIFLSLIFVFVFLVWGFLAPITSASVAPGTIVLSSKTKIIQHLEGGIIKEILVKEGDFVKKCQKLLSLDPIKEKSNLEIF